MSQWAEIRHLHLVERVPKKEIARPTLVDLDDLGETVPAAPPAVSARGTRRGPPAPGSSRPARRPRSRPSAAPEPPAPAPRRRVGRTTVTGLGGWTVRLPWHGGHGRRMGRRGAARGRPGRAARPGHPERRCLPRRPWRANVPLVGGEAQRGWRGRLWGGWSSQASPRPRRLAPARASRDDLQAGGLGRTARRARRPASRRGSRARRHRRSRRCAGRRVGGHGRRLRGQSVSPPPPAGAGTGVPLGSDRPVRCVLPGQRSSAR